MAGMRTRLLILAASAQPGGRCVAGKTLDDDRRWIRPVVGREGVPESRLGLAGGGRADVGDIVEIPLLDENPKSDHQTENRLMADSPWRKVGRARYRDLPQFADAIPGPLWRNGESTQFGENDCVSRPCRTGGSLLLFPARNVIADWEAEVPPSDAADRRRARFSLNGAAYSLRLTDTRKPALFFRECFVCASLTSEYKDGRCHKLAACIIDPGRLP